MGQALMVLGVMAMVLGGCARRTASPSAQASAAAVPEPLGEGLDGAWSITGVADQSFPDGSHESHGPWVTFSTSTGQLEGFSGCNGFRGTFEATPTGQLQLGPLLSTKRGCGPDNPEPEVFAALEAVAAYARSAESLALMDGTGAVVVQATLRVVR